MYLYVGRHMAKGKFWPYMCKDHLPKSYVTSFETHTWSNTWEWSRSGRGQAEQSLALLLKFLGHLSCVGRWPDSCKKLTAEITKALPFLLGTSLSLYLCIELYFLLMHLHWQWFFWVFVCLFVCFLVGCRSVETEVQQTRKVPCFMGPGPIWWEEWNKWACAKLYCYSIHYHFGCVSVSIRNTSSQGNPTVHFILGWKIPLRECY